MRDLINRLRQWADLNYEWLVAIGYAIGASCLFVATILAVSPETGHHPDPSPMAETPTACAERVFLTDGGGFSWGSVTRSSIGPLSVHHVFEPGRTVADGPPVAAIASLEATDFAFLSGSTPTVPPDSVPELTGPVTLEGFPARSGTLERVAGEVYASDTVPPGVWIILDHPEPLVGGFSGGCVRDAAGHVVAVIMGASTMHLDGTPRHFARVIPIRAALSEIQGADPTAPPLSLLGKPLPTLIDGWEAHSSILDG